MANVPSLESMKLKILPKEQKTVIKANGTSFHDPSFISNKTLPMHRWVPWIAGFSSTFVRDILSRYLDKKGVVLDPFAGVGTTLLEAVLQGHDVIGFEINPYAALACNVKISSHNISLELLRNAIVHFSEFYDERVTSDYVPLSKPPHGFMTRHEFYSPNVLRKVLILHDFLSAITDYQIKQLFDLAFAATLVSYSNYSYEPSLASRASTGKPEISDFPVGETIIQKLSEMAEDILWFTTHMVQEPTNVNIINDSFFKYESYLQSDSIDLIITSPPYLNNYHYNRNTRPHLYWLNYAKMPKDLKGLENSNFGKYWQTVRDLEKVELEFSLPGVDLEDKLNILTEVNQDKGSYGGRGWANYATSYFNDCRRFAAGIEYSLKPGGSALVVIGNSILQGIEIPTDQYFAKIAESMGLELIGIEVPRHTRTGNSIIQSNIRVNSKNLRQNLYEAIVELRKPQV